MGHPTQNLNNGSSTQFSFTIYCANSSSCGEQWLSGPIPSGRDNGSAMDIFECNTVDCSGGYITYQFFTYQTFNLSGFVGTVNIIGSTVLGILPNGATNSFSFDTSKYYVALPLDLYGTHWDMAFLGDDGTRVGSPLDPSGVNSPIGGDIQLCVADIISTSTACGATGGTVSLSEAQNGVISPDFANWVISYTGLPASSSYLEVRYGQNSSTLTYSEKISFSPFINLSPIAIVKTQPLWFPPLTIPATWYAMVSVLDYSNNVLVSSPLSSFYIDPGHSAPPVTTTSIMAVYNSLSGGETSSTIATTVNCQYTSSSFIADPVGNIQNGICNALSFLFLPNSPEQKDISNRFTSLGTQVKTKPPFGYFTSGYGALSNFQDNGTSTLMTASTSAAFGVIFTPIDDGITVLLWFGFVFWVIRTFRNLNT